MNKRHYGLTFLLLCCLTSLVAAQDIVAIRGVSIIDGTGAPLLTELTVLIRGNRIAAVGPTSDISVPKEAAIVDGKGKFLIPGLWDMHVHFRGAMEGGERLVKENEATLPVYVAHGVTTPLKRATVRGPDAPWVIAISERVREDLAQSLFTAPHPRKVARF